MKTIRKITIIFGVLCLLLCLFSCKGNVRTISSSDTLYVRKIEGLNDGFLMAMDVSSLYAIEDAGIAFHDYEGNETDVLDLLAKSGITHVKLRIWNDPKDENGHAYGGGNCDLEKALSIAKRADSYGLKLIIEFQYSDFWADEERQNVPKDWKTLRIEDKAESLYDFTYNALREFKSAGIDVAMVCLGHESDNGLSGESDKANVIGQLMKSGSNAVREVFPKALIAVNYSDTGKNTYLDLANSLDHYGLDYDVFSITYHPYKHETPDELTEALKTVAERYGKKVMVMETSSIVAAGYTGNYPTTVQGDANAILDVIEAVSYAGGIGVCYFDSSYIRTLTRNYEEDRAIQEKYGIDSSTYGKEYDSQSKVTGEMFEGKSFFGEDGTALESLKLFALCHKGNLIEVKADALEDDEIDIETGDDIRLPETVTAIMNDNSRSEVPVKWQALDLNELQKTGPRKITVNGEADGLPVRFSINIIEHNYLRDPSFEEDSNNTVIPSGWQVVEHMNAQELGVKENVIDSLSGKKHYHFCSKQRDMIDFDLYQELTDLPSGTYRFQISATGGGFNENRSYAYVLIDGESYMSYGLSFTSDSWSTAIFQAVPYESGQKLTVGIRIIGNDDGNGAYGRIDDAMLNLLEE